MSADQASSLQFTLALDHQVMLKTGSSTPDEARQRVLTVGRAQSSVKGTAGL